ncbi:MAG TPA: hypothetical protein VJN02_09100 [Gammaproteobacteria bacterium]|nr:hypothetical protein [Gammaproteobacteria bacterium]
MLKYQRTSILNFIRWLTESYIKLEKKTLPNPCKLIGTTNKNDKLFVQIQLAGQSHLIEVEPEKIINQNLFEYFSSRDKKELFLMVYNKERLKLSDQFYNPETNEEMIVLTNLLTGNKMTISASDISIRSDLINQINSKDTNKIGFISGMEYIKKCFNYLKSNNNV